MNQMLKYYNRKKLFSNECEKKSEDRNHEEKSVEIVKSLTYQQIILAKYENLIVEERK